MPDETGRPDSIGEPDPAGSAGTGLSDPSGLSLAAAPPAWMGNPEVSQDPLTRPILLTRALTFRNFAGFPFVVSAPPNACAIIADKALDLVSKSRGCPGPAGLSGLTVWRLADCPPRLIRLFREREILPMRAWPFPGKKGYKFLAVAHGGGNWTLVNEVEHLTFGRILAGYPSPEALEAAFTPPAEGADHSPWAWSGPFGYLASHPGRIGPGCSLEAVAHLPALALSRQLAPAGNYLAAAGLELQSLASPEAADAALFRIKPRGGLGNSPREIREAFLAALRPVLSREMEARELCLEKHRKRLEDRVRQSLGILSGSVTLTYAGLLAAGSIVRLGAALGLANPQIAGILEELRVTVASGHLAVTSGRELAKEEEDFSRANVVRLYLKMHSGEIT